MFTLIPTLLGFFSSTGLFAKYFIRIGQKFANTLIVLPIQILVVGALVVAKISFLITLITLVVYIYNQMKSILNYIDTLSLDSVLAIPFLVLDSLGIISAFMDVFSMFTFVMISLLLLFISRFVLESLKLASDEFYKIGMLINSGTTV